ncbi:nucleotidyltransferase domain-containing protein [Mammaliicoccus sciuri]|uniref:nucleotidyltransferase domain-containing protein n=1 Tax=Mammaliicoccus sciuri TaxID=1296 RepID=UPI002DBE0EA9|nr:nucleotidyltransferase [Mammaliicoccus sciuri]MEB8265390.1 nucleotidyltransferase [Mammaliicoccus sciuri]
MTIPISQLEIWSKQGAIDTPKKLKEKIEKSLKSDSSKIQNKSQLNIFLQGSYRNSTNIYGNSDVDIVVQHNSTFSRNISNLTQSEIEMYKEIYKSATYTWEDFKKEIIKTLSFTFGAENIEIANKSIKINTGIYEADVIPCFEYRNYLSFGRELSKRNYITGIKFYTEKDKAPIINYPKMHYENGVIKNKNVYGNYKPTIRIFKNLKKELVKNNIIKKELAPSYFVENLLYNVPDEKYMNYDISTRIYNILKWLYDNKNSLNKFKCQNEQIELFGDSQEQWNELEAKKFISSVINLWNEW